MERQGSQTGSYDRPPTKPHHLYPEDQGTSTEKDIGGCLRGRPLQVASALAANVILLCFGYKTAYPAAVWGELKENYSEEQISWIMTAPMLSIFVGAGIWSQITLRTGPKYGALAAGITMLIGWCLHFNIGDYWCLMAGRVLGGIASGGMFSSIPHYVNEIAEDSLRGTLGSIANLAISVGALLAYALGGFLNAFYMTLVGVALSAIFIVVFFPCPESPIYLTHSNRADHGRRNLRRLRWPRDIGDELASTHSTSVADKNSWIDLLKKRAARKALFISFAMFTIQQSGGAISLLSYVTDIFGRAGGDVDPVTGSCIVASVQIIGTLIGMSLIERFGRRVLMMASCLGMALTHGLMGYALMPGSGAPGWLPVTCLSIFLLAYTLGAAIVPILVMNELSSATVRSKVASVSVFYNGIIIFITLKTYPVTVRVLGLHCLFWIYGTGCAVGLVFTFFFLPETAGRSNASIQEELEGNGIKQCPEKHPK